MTATIALILRSVAAAVTLGLFGKSTSKIGPIINTVAALAEVPAETAEAQASLLKVVDTWVAENRGPTDEELAAIRDLRESLDTKIVAALAALRNKGGTP